MIEFLVCFGAFAIVLLFVRLGIKAGGFLSLGGMLGSVFALFVAMRYWFQATRAASSYEKASMSVMAVVVFWVIFLLVAFIFKKLRENYTDTFEFIHPSIIDHALGALFGLVSGAAYVTALMMTLTIAAAQLFPAYKPESLPLAVDRWPLQAYHFVESMAGVPQSDSTHTPLPSLKDAGSSDPAKFWK